MNTRIAIKVLSRNFLQAGCILAGICELEGKCPLAKKFANIKYTNINLIRAIKTIEKHPELVYVIRDKRTRHLFKESTKQKCLVYTIFIDK